MSIKIGKDCYIAPTAVIIGDVTIGDKVMICDHVVLRGDVNTISISNETNVQDSVTVHAEAGNPVSIGSEVSLGHNAVIHGCTISDKVLIGMGSIVMTGAYIASGCVVGAGSLVTEGFEAVKDSLILGSPAKTVKRDSKYRTMAELNSFAYKKLRENYLIDNYDRITGTSYNLRGNGEAAGP